MPLNVDLINTGRLFVNGVEITANGSGNSDYKQAKLPNPSYVTQTEPRPDLFGQAREIPDLLLNAEPFITLENGHLAETDYCIATLENGIFIFEAFDVELPPLTNNGYFVAFKQNDLDPTILEKVAELPMTDQFWDNWYDYTVKDSGPNTVKFVTANAPYDATINIESWITTLTYSNGNLIAVDSRFNFSGHTVISLYNQLSGLALEGGLWNYQRPEYILDDDYYGMAVGKEVGWYYYRNTGTETVNDTWNCVGFNILTGEVRWITPGTTIPATITNFNFNDMITSDFGAYIREWYNHPNGITFSFSDVQELNNGDNVNYVTCVWSPFYENPNQVLYLNAREAVTGEFIVTGGGMLPRAAEPNTWYWDNTNFYYFHTNQRSSGYSMIVNKFDTNTKQSKTWVLPLFEDLGRGISTWANNNGVMAYMNDGNGQTFFGKYRYEYFKSDDTHTTLQSNNVYPTNMIGNKSYSYWSSLSTNIYNIGIEIDEYKDITF